MKVCLPIEQWNALDEAAKRNIELLTLARANIANAARDQAAGEAKAQEQASRKKKP